MRRFPFIVGLATVSVACLSIAAAADSGFNSVSPKVYDPFQTELVNSSWISGIGCPSGATTAIYGAQGITPSTYTDTACAVGDPRDTSNEGLLMAKTGPTANDAAAVAVLDGVQGTVVTELGYDIRKQGPTTADPRGSHCGAGAPRFDVTLENGLFFFIGCESPPATTQFSSGQGWTRLRWGGSAGPLQGYLNGVLTTLPVGIAVKSISIVFDEGQDAGPDNFGLAVLDNIDVNGQLVGRGGRASN